MKKILFLSGLVLLVAASCDHNSSPLQNLNSGATSSPANINISASSGTPVSNATTTELSEPITGGLSRVTKKPFGIYVTPQNSPVSPERFTGYHTGIDFETTPAETNIDVPVFAACAGKLLVKEYASGYGGVAVQSCTLDGNPVTIIYGHLRLASIIPNVGAVLKTGNKIAVLGTGYSTETDGERKNLHFGIHKGTAINILGYVQKKSDLSGWLDPEQYLK